MHMLISLWKETNQSNAVYLAQIKLFIKFSQNKSTNFFIVASNFFNAKIIFSKDIRYVAYDSIQLSTDS